jgi:N-acetylglucosamine-6-phosphate deacetylase
VLIAAAQLITAEGQINQISAGYVQFDGETIGQAGTGRLAPGSADLELPDGYLLPGFVDLQVNGYFG